MKTLIFLLGLLALTVWGQDPFTNRFPSSVIGTNDPVAEVTLDGDNVFTGSNTFTGPIFADAVEATTFTADSYLGDFSGVTNLNASELRSGTVPDARLASSVVRSNSPTIHTPTLIDPTVQGTLTAATLNVGTINLTNGINATNLTGVIDDARLASNVQRTNDAIAASRLTTTGVDTWFWVNNAGGFDLTSDGGVFTNLTASALIGIVPDASIAGNILRSNNVAGSAIYMAPSSTTGLGFFSSVTELLTILPELEHVLIGGSLWGGDATFSGNVTNTSGAYYGSGVGLTSLNAANLTADGQLPRLKIVGLDVVTNLWTINTAFGLGTNYVLTSGAATGGITDVSGVPTATERIGQLVIKTTGDLVFTNPVAFYTSDGVDSRTFTNGNLTSLIVHVIPGFSTNLVFSWSK